MSRIEPFRTELSWLQADKLADLNAQKQIILNEGRELFDFSMINPDIPPARVIIDKLVEASLKPFNHRYSVSRGITRLRQAFAEKYASRFSVTLDPDKEVCVTMGTKDAIHDAIFCVASPGERVLMGSPTYPAHISAAKLAGVEVDFFPLSADEDAMLAAIAERLDAGSHKVLVLNFPNNPTGISVSSSFYERLVQIAKAKSVLVVNDFVYGEMGYRGALPSLLSAPGAKDVGVEVYSMSKAYSVPGWRVAALSGNPRLVHQVTRLKAHVDYGIFMPIQAACAFALSTKDDLVKHPVAQYNNRCGVLASGLKRLGWTVEQPSAGACVWGGLPEGSGSLGSMQFAVRLLADTGVLVMPGVLFGEEFDSHVRFAAVMPEERIRAMLGLLSRYGEAGAAPEEQTATSAR